MRTYFVLGIAAFLFASSTAHADLTIKNVTLYDGTGAPARAGVTVVVKGDRISEIAPGAKTSGKVIDGSGKYLIPGLMDAHIHLPGGQTGNVNNPSERKLVVDKPVGMKYLHGYLYVGVTAIYDSSNNPDYIFAMREDEQKGRIVSPRIFGAGGIITVPNGYASGPAALKVENWDQARAELDKRLVAKPDMLKIAMDRQGILAQPAVPGLSNDMFTQIVQYAASKGVRSTVHIAAEADAEAVVNAGVAALAHPVWRSIANDSFIKLAAAKKIPIATTLSYLGNIARVQDDPGFWDDPLYRATIDPEEVERGKTTERQRYQDNGMSPMMKLMLPHAMRNTKRLHDAGAVLALGTDRTQPPAVHQELEFLVKAGISPFDCIRIATLNAAAYVGRDKDFGSIEAGKWADMVLLTADPAADVANFRTIAAVIKGGKEIDRSKLDIPANRKK